MKSVEIYVSGLVQGVGFRAAVSRYGRQLGLSGYVRNKADGRVHIVVQGTPEKVDFFAAAVRAGCGSFAQVDEVEVLPHESEASLPEEFAVR